MALTLTQQNKIIKIEPPYKHEYLMSPEASKQCTLVHQHSPNRIMQIRKFTLSNYKSQSLSPMEEISAQRIQRDLVEPKGSKRHENSTNDMTQQIVPVAQTSTKLSSEMTNTLKEQKDEALNSNGSLDQAKSSRKTLTFSTSQLTFAQTIPWSRSTDSELFKLPTSQRESQLKSLKPTYHHKITSERKSGRQLQLKPSSYPQASPISRRTITSRQGQGASLSPSSKLNQSKAGYQVVASIIEQDVQHFQSILKMPQTAGLDLSYKQSPQSKVTKTTELTEKLKPYYEKSRQSQLIPSTYPQASPISRRTITSRQGASPSPSSKLNQSNAGYQVVASVIEQDMQHFQSILKMPETVGLDLSYKRSPISKVTKTTELTEKSKPYYEKCRTYGSSSNSNYAGTVTKPSTVTSNELIQLTSPWLPFPVHNYSRESNGIKSRELIHSPTSRMEPKFVSNDISNGSSNQDHSEWNENKESNKELMSSQAGNNETFDSGISSQAEKDETVIEQEIPLFLSKYPQEEITYENSSFEKELQLVPFRTDNNYDHQTQISDTKSANLNKTSENQEKESDVTLTSSRFYSGKKDTKSASSELIEPSLIEPSSPWVPRFYRASDGFELFEFSHSTKSRIESTFASNKMSNSYNYWKLNENNETGKELTSSPLTKSMEWQSNSSNESVTSETEPGTQIPLSSSARPQKNGSDGNISSKELLKLIPDEADLNYAQTQSNATNSTAFTQLSEKAEMQSQVLLSSSQLNSALELSNGAAAAADQNEFVQMNTTSQVTENNHQELTELQATNNEILEISVSNDSPWYEDEIEIASSSQPMYLLPYSTEQLQLLPLQANDVQTSRNNDVIISNELTDELATSGTYTYTIINGPAEQTKLQQPKAYATKPTGSKSIELIQQAGAPNVSSQITLPSSQSHYARADQSDKTIQSTSSANPSESTFVRKSLNKFEIQSNVLIKPSTTNVQAKSKDGRMQPDDSTQKRQTQPGKPQLLPTQVAVQSNLKAPVNGKGNVRAHPYGVQKKSNESSRKATASKINPAVKAERKTNYAGPTSNNTLIKPNGSTKQPALVVNSHLNLPQDDFSVEVPQGHDVDRVMQKTKKVVQWGKLPQPLPKPKTSLKRKPKENISPITPSKKRSLQEEPGVKINMLDSSGMSFRLPEISVQRIQMVGGVEQKVGVTGIKLKTPFKSISKNKTLADCAETLLRNNVSVFKLQSKPVDKAIENYLKILEKNNVRVVKLNKK